MSMNDEELRMQLDELYTIAIFGGSPLASDEENEQLQQKASRDIDNLIESHTQQIALAAKQELAKEFTTVAIPETNDFANGWNACRKWVRANLNKLAGLEYSELYSKMPYDNGTWKAEASLKQAQKEES